MKANGVCVIMAVSTGSGDVNQGQDHLLVVPPSRLGQIRGYGIGGSFKCIVLLRVEGLTLSCR